MVKGGDPVDFAEGQFQVAGDVHQHVVFEIAESFLGFVQHFDQGVLAVLAAFHGDIQHLKPLVAAGMGR